MDAVLFNFAKKMVSKTIGLVKYELTKKDCIIGDPEPPEPPEPPFPVGVADADENTVMVESDNIYVHL